MGETGLVSGPAEALRWMGAALWLGTISAEMGLPGSNPELIYVLEQTHAPMAEAVPAFAWAWIRAQGPEGGEREMRRWLTTEMLTGARGLNIVYSASAGKRKKIAEDVRKLILPPAIAMGAVCLLLGLGEGRLELTGEEAGRPPGGYAKGLMESAYWRMLAAADDERRRTFEELQATVDGILRNAEESEGKRESIARALVATHYVLAMPKVSALAVEGLWTMPVGTLVEMRRRDP